MEYISEQDIREASEKEKISILKKIANGQVKVEKLGITEKRVKELLEEFPHLRNSDETLYTAYVETFHSIDFNKDTFINHKEYRIPSFKTIERIRRDLEKKYKHLEADNKTKIGRENTQKQYMQKYGKDTQKR